VTCALRCAPDDLERNHRRIDSSSLHRLPIVLSHPVSAAVGISAVLVSLPARVIDLVTVAEQRLTAIGAVVARTSALPERAEHVISTAEDVIRRADRAVTDAGGTAQQARTLTDSAIALLDPSSGTLDQLASVVRRLAETTQASDIDALVDLAGRLPQLADAMHQQVLPQLVHLQQVAPDVHQLLDLASQLSHMATRLPKVFRRPHHQPS